MNAQAPTASWIDRDFVAYHAGTRARKTACIELKTGERVSYGALDIRVSQAVVAIERLCGDVRGRPLALLARNSIDYLAFIVACFRTGAVMQPLNWRLSAAELEVILTDAEPALVVYDEEFAGPAIKALEAVPGARAMTSAAFFDEAHRADPADARNIPAGPDGPLFLLYTSGTTGKPKGAVITRLNAYFQAQNFASCADVGVGSMMLCDGPLFHVVGLIAATWTTLLRGGCFAISDRFIPAETLARLLDEDLGATHYFGVPQIARTLLEDPAYRPRALNRLTAFIVGGAPVPLDLIERLLADKIKVSHGFGMTETGTVMHMPLDLEIIRAKPSSVGLPAPAMQVRVVDEAGEDVPDGQPGELVLRGPAVTAGYWRRPDATRSAFFDDWFRSGDIGMRDSDGYFYVLDRSKDMYISGGENVYPAEVESALMRIAGVADAAVIGTPDDRWGEVGVAYVVLKDDAAMLAEHVIAACGQWLAPYKRPKHVRFVEAIPRNANGKAQKTILKQRPL